MNQERSFHEVDPFRIPHAWIVMAGPLLAERGVKGRRVPVRKLLGAHRTLTLLADMRARFSWTGPNEA